MVAAGERNEARVGDFGGYDAAFFRWGDAVGLAVKDDGGDGDLRQQRTDVDLVASPHELDEIAGRDGGKLQAFEPLLLLGGGSFGDVEAGDEVEEGWVALAEVKFDEFLEGA